MRRVPVTPLDAWRLGWEIWWLAAEAGTVIAIRSMGLAGMWNTTARERIRMLDEKPRAFAEAGLAAAKAAAGGSPPVAVAAAAVVPLRRRTRANAARLSKRGPRRAG
jgi:hypothetical protein